jgi:hypothetical protein
MGLHGLLIGIALHFYIKGSVLRGLIRIMKLAEVVKPQEGSALRERAISSHVVSGDKLNSKLVQIAFRM